jgi:3-hydroxyisobutyrate dehydrogenase-like beta-hydroxyacid dehydrogenase
MTSTTAAAVGLVGLGRMGGALAGSLRSAGYEVIGHDVNDRRVAAFVRLGGQAAASAADVAGRCERLLTCLPTSAALDAVADDIGAADPANLIVAETSTLPLEVKERARSVLADAGAVMLDCTLSGTAAQAREGDLSVYASGDADAFEQVRDVFDEVARSTHFVGPFGTGSKMKFIANLLVAIHNLSTAEALVLAMKAGLDPETVVRVVSDGAGTSRMLEVRGPVMVDQRYDDAAATLQMFAKDLDIIGDFAAAVGAPTPLLSAVLPYYTAGIAQGRSEQDAAALCAVLEAMAGHERRSESDGTS